jgi:hypothetical protein
MINVPRPEDLTPEQLIEVNKIMGDILNDFSQVFAAALFGNPQAVNFLVAPMKCEVGQYDYRIIFQKKGRRLPPEEWTDNDR